MDFRISISRKAYIVKSSSTEITKMYFKSDTISLEAFAELIRSGYNFAHNYNTKSEIFHTKEKTINNFKESSFIYIDVDNANKPLNDFVGSLTYTPTISYTTPSNNNDTKDYRLRLVYVFSTPITTINDFQNIYYNLESQMNKDNGLENKDSCGSNVSQYMNGSYGCDMINDFSKIYNINDFKNLIQNNNVKYNSLYINLNETDNTITKLPKNTKLSKKFLNDLNTLEPFKFLQKYKAIYPIIERTPVEFKDGYALLNEDYVEIKRKWTWGSIETENGLSKLYTITQKIKDGQGRRYHIGLAAMIRKKILPSITLEHLIVNAVYDRLYYYDNSDGVLSNQVIIERCCYVMNLKEITIKSYNTRKFMVDKEYWTKQGINANQAKNIIRKQLNYDKIDSWYDINKSVNENYLWAKENDIKVSRATLYRYVKDTNIDNIDNIKNSEYDSWFKDVVYAEPKIDDRNLDLINEINAMYQLNDSEKNLIQNNNEKHIIDNNNIIIDNTNKEMENIEFLNKVDIMINRLSDTNNIELLTINFNKALEWVDKMILKYDLNIDKQSIINDINKVYDDTMSNLSTKESTNKGELLYRIQVSNYNSNELYDLIKLLQQKIKVNFYINDLLIESNDDGYPWELIANRQNEYVVTAA